MTVTRPRQEIRIGHSPDPDDAFMFFGFACGQVASPAYTFVQVLKDIESLNHLALEGRIEVTAVSIHAYAHIADRYALLPCGASMGEGYGPIVVTRDETTIDQLEKMTIAVPGRLTSANLALRLALGEVRTEVIPFDRIMDRVADGSIDAGLLIHEGQLTYRSSGLHKVLDLGEWWQRETDGLPLPLGGNAIRKDLGHETIAEVGALLRRSIEYGLSHRQEALTYAMDYSRGMERTEADRFVGMYVNDYTLDYGEKGRRAVELFLERGVEAGVIQRSVEVEFTS